MSLHWKVSLHGGHSRDFCEHARDPLRDLLEAAVRRGFSIFGVSEHAPRVESRFLYPSEVEKGYDPHRLVREFDSYGKALHLLAEEFSDRLQVLRGFEAEVVPSRQYVSLMQEYRRRHRFDYMVGSVHYVAEIQIDGPRSEYESALEHFGSLEKLAVAYYDQVAEMVAALRPEVVGHLDVIRKNAASYGSVETPPVQRAAERALEAVREAGAILDLNTAGYRKGLGTPYPAPWLVQLAHRMGIGFCFGDDSHSVEEVGDGLEEARTYLLKQGVTAICVLERRGDGLERRSVFLD